MNDACAQSSSPDLQHNPHEALAIDEPGAAGIPWPRTTASAPAPHLSGVDWHGLALDLESEAQCATSQTMQRAMNAAAHGLRQMGQHGAIPLHPVLLEAEAALEVAVARVEQAHPGATRTSEHLGLAAVRAALAGQPRPADMQLADQRKNSIYVAGPMTGHKDLNFPAFHAAAAALRAQGHHVENPAEINADPNPNAQWLDCMRRDIARLVSCDAIYLLPGWSKSRGAALEALCAYSLSLHFEYAPNAERIALLSALQVIQALMAWPAGLAHRVEAALQRIEAGSCIRRIPADPTDPDLVLAEVKALINAGRPPFWLKPEEQTNATAAPAPEFIGVDMASGPEKATIGLSPAARDVLLERIRQVEEEGWTPEHDDEHHAGEMAAAAGCYALFAHVHPNAAGLCPGEWPWNAEWWKPTDYRGTLVKAGALIIAELERLDRAAEAEGDLMQMAEPSDEGVAE